MLRRAAIPARSRQVTLCQTTRARFHSRTTLRANVIDSNTDKVDDLLIEDTYALLRNDYRIMNLDTYYFHALI